jgi:hypothetical protein
LSWYIKNVKEAHLSGGRFNNFDVTGPDGSESSGPLYSDTTYSLRVVMLDGSERTHTATCKVDIDRPPVIRSANSNVTYLCYGDSPAEITFTAEVTDDRGVAAVTLRWRLDESANWETQRMTRLSDDSYQTELTNEVLREADDHLEWAVRVQDTAYQISDSNSLRIEVKHC